MLPEIPARLPFLWASLPPPPSSLSCSTLGLIKAVSPQKEPRPRTEPMGLDLARFQHIPVSPTHERAGPSECFSAVLAGQVFPGAPVRSCRFPPSRLSSSPVAFSGLLHTEAHTQQDPAIGSPSSHVLWVHEVPCPLVFLQKCSLVFILLSSCSACFYV